MSNTADTALNDLKAAMVDYDASRAKVYGGSIWLDHRCLDAYVTKVADGKWDLNGTTYPTRKAAVKAAVRQDMGY